MKCPDCSKEIFRATYCNCGWVKPEKRLGLCSWSTYGKPCQMLGTISPTIRDDGKWFCLWHFHCLSDTKMSTNRKDFARVYPFKEFDRAEEYWDRTQGVFTGIHQVKKELTDWDVGNQDIIKGLVVLGSKSKAWSYAPEDCRQAAIELYNSGWRPSLEVSV